MADNALSKTYDPNQIELSIYEAWEAAGRFEPGGSGEPYCIMIPPPNVTGSLHMGHAFQDTIMDMLIRYHRMIGRNTLWQAGTDHAGIATQMVVERQLGGEGTSRHALGREAFIDRVWQWKEQSGGTITRQLRRMGASLDWSRERFTMDEGLSDAVKEVFIQLYEKDLIYRGTRLVNWDPQFQTALADIEVLSEEENGHLWHMRYPLSDGDGHLVVATTRPETMLGDTAVAVHPEDERYRGLIGRMIRLPLTDREIPVIADEYVDPEFGSGCVKITPAHDFNDYEVGRRHDLPLLNIFNTTASVNLPGSAYHGMDRYDARKQIVADLQEQGLIEKIDDHKLMVPRGDRSNAVVEPFLTDQWFVKAGPLAQPAIKAVEDGRIKFVPERWNKTYYEWMNNIQDWCISRQLWWGHRIPAWYDADGNIFVARSETEAQAKATEFHGKEVILRQDEDVLDTWFSSALWPFSTLGWPEQTAELKTFYPTTVLVTGFDIIFFWVARMVMMGLEFMGDVPFKEIYMHGLVRDADGQKMSKSKGNVLDPLDLIDGIDLESLVSKRTTGLMQQHIEKKIEKATRRQFPDGIPAYGTDALRFTFASLATQGRDIRFDLGRISGNRNFCNKIWNASRFVFMNLEGHEANLHQPDAELGAADKWIISRLQKTEAEVNEAIKSYRFDWMAQSLYSFVWDEYCDWYLELAKVTLSDEVVSDQRKAGTRRTLIQVLEASLRLLHPIMPYITEAIWQKAAPLAADPSEDYGDSIMDRPYPQPQTDRIESDSEQAIEWVKTVVTGVRNIRGEMNIAPGKPLAALLADTNEQQQQWLAQHGGEIRSLARLQSVELSDAADTDDMAMALVGNTRVLIPLGDVIDRDAELSRLTRESEKIEKDIVKTRSKLENPAFVERAPADIVEKEKLRLSELETAHGSLKDQISRVTSL